MTMPDTFSLDAAQSLWQGALGELQLRMARATFDTWLRGSRVTAIDGDAPGPEGTPGARGGTWTVYVRHAYAVDWLEHRLLPTIEGVVQRMAGQDAPGRLIFTTTPEPDEPDPTTSPTGGTLQEQPAGHAADEDQLDLQTITLPDLVAFEAEFNERIKRRGFALLTNYAIRYWSELVGPTAFMVWLAAFARDKRDKRAFTGLSQEVKFSIARLARMAAGGRVQAVRGVWRKCPTCDGKATSCYRGRNRHLGADGICRYWQPGAFDVLRAERIGVVHINRGGAWRPWDPILEEPGEALRRQRYRLQVYVPLPLLTPAQVARLEDVSQDEHESWLEEAGIDKSLWESLNVDTLGMTAIEAGGAS